MLEAVIDERGGNREVTITKCMMYIMMHIFKKQPKPLYVVPKIKKYSGNAKLFFV